MTRLKEEKVYMYIGFHDGDVNFPSEKEYDLYSKLPKILDINSKEFSEVFKEHGKKLIAYDKRGNIHRPPL